MAGPFRREASRGGVLRRLLGGGAQAAAAREVERVLAEARRVAEVPAERIAAVADRHGVDLADSLRDASADLYRRFLEHCIRDRELSEQESEDLVHLRGILRLPESDAARTHGEVAGAVYGAAIDRVLADQRIDPDEKRFLERLRAGLRLPPEQAEALQQEGAKRARERFVARTMAHDSALLASKGMELELEGASPKSVEEAVRAAVEEAARAVPDLSWAEVREIRTRIRQGRVTDWHVKLRAGRGAPPDPEP